MEMVLIFTSFRDSMNLDGLKLAIDRHIPRLCSYPTVTFLLLPYMHNLTGTNKERMCNTILDNNWDLIADFITEMHELGISHIVFCDWATKEQIAHGKFCPAGLIGTYIQGKLGSTDPGFGFPITLDMRDGRESL